MPASPLHPANLPEAPGWPLHPAMVTSGNELPGFRIARCFGVVRGLTVRSAGLGGGIAASFQALGGGNVEVFRELCDNARRDAFLLMMQDAVRYQANGIIGLGPVDVSGRNRVPSPPAMMTAFIECVPFCLRRALGASWART